MSNYSANLRYTREAVLAEVDESLAEYLRHAKAESAKEFSELLKARLTELLTEKYD